MKILLYNWIPFDENLKGGGVTVYTRNIVNKLANEYKEHELYFLCAGSYYDNTNISIRYEQIALNYKINCKAFTIVNSPVFAPAYLQFFHMDKTLNDTSLRTCFLEFMKNEGPFDVVHFQNLEGLSVNAFSCKELFPNTKFVYSIHNYYAFCPRVDLWRGNIDNCSCKNTGEECLECMICHVPGEKLRKKMEMTYELRKAYSEDKKKLFDEKGKIIDEEYFSEEHRKLTESEKQILSTQLELYRIKMVDAINNNMDCILAVSQRVSEIAIEMGVRKDLVKVSYIGTEVAQSAINKYSGRYKAPLTMIFMGYQNTEKGFFFLMDALDKMSLELSKNINLLIVARGNVYNEEMLNTHKKKFNSVTFKNGYSREELTELLSMADFGVVPVLWEDNLPQIAIEMAANGVPVISSNRGGAKELTNNSEFVFEAGDTTSFINCVKKIVDEPRLLETYYENYPGLMTMDKHLSELLSFYE